MAEPVRLQLSRKRGYRLQEHSVAINGLPAAKVARPGMFGNPFTIADTVDTGYKFSDDIAAQEFVVTLFRDWLSGSDRYWMGNESEAARARILANIENLRGKNLACFCREGTPCHGDVLIELANK